MVTIGWPMLLLVLIIGLRLDGVSLGLLSGLGLGLLTFSVQPAAPPNDLMLLQATWLLLMATLEATGFFYLLARKLTVCIEQASNHYRLLLVLLTYGLVFFTGDKKWLYRALSCQNGLDRAKCRLLVPLGIAAHMALLASPLSISGILLIVAAGNSGCAILNLVSMVLAITLTITVISSLLTGLLPDRWLPYQWFKASAHHDGEVVTDPKDKVPLTFVFLLLAAMLFLCIQPTANRLTVLSCKVFPVRLPIFFALVMLSIAAIGMLGLQIKPAKILQTDRFKVGIQQFFIFLGLVWLLDSLISHDKAYLIKMLSAHRVGFYLLGLFYMLLVDIPIVIWLVTGLLIEQHCTIVEITLWLVVVHSLAPVRYWIAHIVQAYKKK